MRLREIQTYSNTVFFCKVGYIRYDVPWFVEWMHFVSYRILLYITILMNFNHLRKTLIIYLLLYLFEQKDLI
jgi:hypothetical protein